MRCRLTIAASLIAAFVLASASSVGAESAAVHFSDVQLRRILRMSPLPDLPVDPSNAVGDDPRTADFGEQLFFDPRLSASGEMSCATCHDPEKGWSNGVATSNPEDLFPKNVPSLWNSAYSRWYFWDGRADSGWSQALGPLEGESEMAGNRLQLIHLLRGDRDLSLAYAEVFGALPDGLDDRERFPRQARPMPKDMDHPLHEAWASMTDQDRHTANLIFSNVGKAIAAFERRIIARDTPFDRFVAGLRRDGATALRELSESAQRGLKLFIGRADCKLCHSGPLLSDGEFHDVGIALGSNMRVDPGRHHGVLKLLRSPFTRMGRYADAATPSAPVAFLEQRGHQLGQFKTPSLRNVALTAPYMHDGRFETLTEVIRFYSTREGARPLGHPTTLLQPLGLTEQDVEDLVAFLESLTVSTP